MIRPSELGPAEVTAWHAMQRGSAALGNPFLSPEFTQAAGRHRPDARVAVLTEGGRLAGFLPFEKHRFGVGVPIGAGLTDCQGLVHEPGLAWDPRDVLRGCGLSVFAFDHLAVAAAQQPFRPYLAATAPSPVIDLADGWAAYQAKLMVKSAQFCRSVARKTRKLEREAGPVRLVTDSRDRAALGSLMAWKSDQYRRTGRSDRFAHPWIVGLIEDLFETRESHFSSLFSVLYAGDVPVSAHLGLRCGPVLAHWFPAYDTAYGQYSPGLAQHLRMVEAAAGIGVQLIDLGKGAKRYKETLKSSDIYVGEGAVTTRSALGQLHRAHIVPAQWAVRTIRAQPRLYDSADHLLKRYGELRAALPRLSRPESRAEGGAGPPGQPAPGPRAQGVPAEK
ncbi:MAG TPA: GNAT family N-acetyltransferase [Streptosporangiaceae bacterium]|nr:GNAT family N-acetyltransferase [Streptosporangiaceae bacterium]